MRPLLLTMVLTAAGLVLAPFEARGVDAGWAVSQGEGVCRLEQAVRDFGVIRFVGGPGAPLRLEVLGHRDVFSAGPVGVYRVAPPWHPAHPQRVELGASGERVGSSVIISEPLATRVLMALYEGYEAHLQHAAWYGGRADVRIGNEHLRTEYEAFARCLQDATALGWSEFERTRIEYASDQIELTPADRRRLKQVASYVLADPAVSRVFVDGHTDAVGTEAANRALSKRRAETVADYLASFGIPRERLIVRFHGSAYPVARSATDAAHARNRRTTIRLEREWQDGDVASR